MGIIDYLSHYFSVSPYHRKRRKPMQTVEIKVKMDCDGCERRVRNSVAHMKVEIKVKMDCDGCERRVRNSVAHMKGVKQVEVNRKQSKVTVTGNLDRNRVLKKVQNTGKRAEFWPYIPYNLVAYPYVAQAYDKKAPAGYVKNTGQALGSPNALDEKLTSLFSDENPNGCAIM